MLDNEADALLARINAAQARKENLDRAMTRRAVSAYMATRRPQSAPAVALCGSGNERLNVTPGQRTLIISRILIRACPTNMAVPFHPGNVPEVA